MRMIPLLVAAVVLLTAGAGLAQNPGSPEPIVVSAGYAPPPTTLAPAGVAGAAACPVTPAPPAACRVPADCPPVLLPPPPVPAAPVVRYRPVIPLARSSRPVYYGQGWLGQPKVYVQGQPIRNFLRYLGP